MLAEAVSGASQYNWVWIILGLLTIVTVLREAKVILDRRAVRNDKLDKIIESQEVVRNEVTPNGGDTNKLGDRVVKLQKSHDELTTELTRLTTSLGEIASAFSEHVKKDDVVQEALLIAIRGMNGGDKE